MKVHPCAERRYLDRIDGALLHQPQPFLRHLHRLRPQGLELVTLRGATSVSHTSARSVRAPAWQETDSAPGGASASLSSETG